MGSISVAEASNHLLFIHLLVEQMRERIAPISVVHGKFCYPIIFHTAIRGIYPSKIFKKW
jgi:hypothetical protein